MSRKSESRSNGADWHASLRPPASTETRRGFFRDSSLWLASALPAPERLVREKPYRLGLLGCDRKSRALVSMMLAAFPQIRLVALADRFPDRIQAAARGLKSRFPAQFAVEVAGRLAGPQAAERLAGMQIDGVVVGSPPPLRGADMQLFREVGRDAYCELPIGRVHGFADMRSARGAAATSLARICIDPFGHLHCLLAEIADEHRDAFRTGGEIDLRLEFGRATPRRDDDRADEELLWRSHHQCDGWGRADVALRMHATAVAAALFEDMPIATEPMDAEGRTVGVGAPAEKGIPGGLSERIDSAWRVRFAHRQQLNLYLRQRERPCRLQIELVAAGPDGRAVIRLQGGSRREQPGSGAVGGDRAAGPVPTLGQPMWYNWVRGNDAAIGMANRIAAAALAADPPAV